MRYIIFTLLLLLVVYLVICLWKKERLLKEALTQAEELRFQIERANHRVKSTEAIRAGIWDCVNVIHLYAALSEEESRSASVKEKQSEITKQSEKIVKLMQNDR